MLPLLLRCSKLVVPLGFELVIGAKLVPLAGEFEVVKTMTEGGVNESSNLNPDNVPCRV